jgi:translation initiation factor IF-3
MVAPPPPPPPPSDVPVPIQPTAAICRIVDMEAEAQEKETAEKETKKLAQQTKELELNWAIAAHDLSHKMRRLEEFLAKGMRVELLLARKKASRTASKEEGELLVEKVKEAVANVPGAIEYKKVDGSVGAVMRMFFEGPKSGKVKKKKGDAKAAEEEE